MKVLILFLLVAYVSANSLSSFRLIGSGSCKDSKNNSYDACYYSEDTSTKANVSHEECAAACLRQEFCLGFKTSTFGGECRMLFHKNKLPGWSIDDDECVSNLPYGYGEGEIASSSGRDGKCYARKPEEETTTVEPTDPPTEPAKDCLQVRGTSWYPWADGIYRKEGSKAMYSNSETYTGLQWLYEIYYDPIWKRWKLDNDLNPNQSASYWLGTVLPKSGAYWWNNGMKLDSNCVLEEVVCPELVYDGAESTQCQCDDVGKINRAVDPHCTLEQTPCTLKNGDKVDAAKKWARCDEIEGGCPLICRDISGYDKSCDKLSWSPLGTLTDSSKTIDDCKAICDADLDCEGFSFEKEVQYCRINKVLGTTMSDVPAVTTYRKKVTVSPTPKPTETTTVEPTDAPTETSTVEPTDPPAEYEFKDVGVACERSITTEDECKTAFVELMGDSKFKDRTVKVHAGKRNLPHGCYVNKKCDPNKHDGKLCKAHFNFYEGKRAKDSAGFAKMLCK